MSGYKRDPYSFHNRSKKGTAASPELIGQSSPVKHIKPPKTTEPADLKTIATILLRKYNALYKTKGMLDPDYIFLRTVYMESAKRELTPEEGKKTLALITWLKGRE